MHVITRRGKNNDYDQVGCYNAYVSQWDAQRNDIFTDMHHVIIDEEYMIWYMSITQQIITLNPEQVPPLGYMQYEKNVQWIQHHVSNKGFL